MAHSTLDLTDQVIVHAANSGLVTDVDGLPRLRFNYEAAQDIIGEWSHDMLRRGYFRSHLSRQARANSLLALSPHDRSADRTREFLQGCTVDVTDWFFDELDDRVAKGAFTLESRGRTETGKSTIMGTVQARYGLPEAKVADAVALYPFSFLIKSGKALQDPDVRVVGLDEDSRTSIGDGSDTREKAILDQEKRIREEGLSTIYNAANRIGDYTRDVTIHCLGNSHKERKVWGLCYEEDRLAGSVFLDWAPEWWYTPYRAMKKDLLKKVWQTGLSDSVLTINALLRDFLRDDDRMERLTKTDFVRSIVKREIKNSKAGQFLTSGELMEALETVLAIGPEWEHRQRDSFFNDQIQLIEDQGTLW